MAKRQGVYTGGKPRLDRLRVKELSSNGIGPAAIARQLGMARSSVYRLLDETADTKTATPTKEPRRRRSTASFGRAS
jgi:DNA invertase Pin-like site-specific DNA recombinase